MSNFITITAKKTGVCKRCGGEITVGQRIRWARGAGAYHLKAECGAESAPYTPRCEVCGVDYTRESHLPSCFHYRQQERRAAGEMRGPWAEAQDEADRAEERRGIAYAEAQAQ